MERVSSTPEVVVLGNAGVDTNVYLPGRDVDWSREANFTENLDYVGQAGGYTSRGYAQLGRRKNFYDGKGHTALCPDLDLCRSVMAGARLAHAHLADWARHLLPIAKDLGLTVACDLQDVVEPADPYRQDAARHCCALRATSDGLITRERLEQLAARGT